MKTSGVYSVDVLLTPRERFQNAWLSVYNLVYFTLMSGPAYHFFGTNRPSLWARITTRVDD